MHPFALRLLGLFLHLVSLTACLALFLFFSLSGQAFAALLSLDSTDTPLAYFLLRGSFFLVGSGFTAYFLFSYFPTHRRTILTFYR